MSVDGGAPVELPLPAVNEGSYSADASHIAYTPNIQWQPAWKQYRGGQTQKVWIANLADSHIEKIPRDSNSNDKNPMWVGDTIYFLSDRDGPVGLFAYDVKARAVKPVIENPAGFDIKSAQAGPGGIVLDQFGTLKLYDTASGQTHTVPVTLDGELPQRSARALRDGQGRRHPERGDHRVGKARSDRSAR